MKKVLKIILALTLILTMSNSCAAGEKILFVPVDDRPVSYSQPIQVLEAAGFEMIVPPVEYVNRNLEDGSINELWDWLEENATSADAAVISADAMLYGGLIPSRSHEFPIEDLNARLNRFNTLHKKNPKLKIYLLSSVMRAPYLGTPGSIEEPPYYAQYGEALYKYGALSDKKETVGLTDSESEELEYWQKNIPEEYFVDWFLRRRKNLFVTETLVDLTADGVISYLIVGLDDHHELSQTRREERELNAYAQKKNLSKEKFQILSGIDEFGLVLLTRAVNDLREETPKVFVRYNKGVGALAFPAYSDEVVSESVEDELKIMNGEIVTNPNKADLIFLVNTDPTGETYHSHNSSPFTRDTDFNPYAPRDGTRYFVDMVERYVKQGYPVGVADITFGNGSDNPMMNLLKRRRLLFKLKSYAGWNTATNSIGFALSTGILTKYMSDEDKDKILAMRYLDDWAYQANVRTEVGDWIYKTFPDGAWTYGHLDGNKAMVEERITRLMKKFVDKNFPRNAFMKEFTVNCIWNRMFEIEIKFSK